MTGIHVIPILRDNYCYVIVHDGHAAVIDPGEDGPVAAFLDKQKLAPETVLLTHHHGDHIDGAAALRQRYGAKIVGPASETARIPGMDRGVRGGDAVLIGSLAGAVIETPGHTRGHIAFHFPAALALFAGDTLFSLGCGRLFEGSAAEMWASLRKLAVLPGGTNLYCGHEYTESNGLFALEADPDNADLLARMNDVRALRAAGLPTLPVTLETEQKTNPFLRAGSAERFAELRAWKDRF